MGSDDFRDGPGGPSLRLRILIVEDDDDARDLVRRMIRTTGDHAVTLAENGEDGLRHLREEKGYDVIVSDIGLPGMSGLEMVDQAVQAGLIDFARVVICSANTWLRRGVLARGARFISKPVDRKKIFAAMTSVSKTRRAW